MGKGNIWLGYGRGAVGSVVMARVKGQQIIRGRNSKPHNRKSRAQILHRSRLSTLYKFTRQLPPGLLDGAFDDMRPRENWQSCFVRHNTKLAIMQPKDWVEDESKPCFGKFMMSSGPVGHDIISVSTQGASNYIGAVGLAFRFTTTGTTVAYLTQELMRTQNLMEGDIITFIIYDVGPAAAIRDPKYKSAYRSPQVLTTSLRLDSADSRQLTDVLHFVEVFTYPISSSSIVRWVGVRCDDLRQPAMAVIVSRVDGQKVSCNTSYLTWPTANQAFWDNFESEVWVSNVLRSWGVSKKALLKGVE